MGHRALGDLNAKPQAPTASVPPAHRLSAPIYLLTNLSGPRLRPRV